MTQGKLITIEGIDGVGKTTQSVELAKNLRVLGYGCHGISFPRYYTPIGQEIRKHQNDKTLNKLTLEEITRLYASDRSQAQKSEILFWINYDSIVINNRYMESNLAYQGARFFEKRREVWDYIRKVELEEFGIRPSDIVILLDIPVEYSAKAMEDQGRFLDVNEEDLDYQKKVRACYLELAALNSESWIVFDCLREDKKTRNPIDVLGKEILEEVKKRLSKKELFSLTDKCL